MKLVCPDCKHDRFRLYGAQGSQDWEMMIECCECGWLYYLKFKLLEYRKMNTNIHECIKMFIQNDEKEGERFIYHGCI